MKHVMIPTDFSVRSLNLVRYAMNHFQHDQVRITLLHFLELPTGITDLLMLPREGGHLQLITQDYRDGIAMLRNHYGERVDCIRTDFLFGAGRRMLRNYLEAQHIDAIVFPENYELRMPSPRSINPEKLIRRSGWPVLSVKIQRPAPAIREESLAALLVEA